MLGWTRLGFDAQADTIEHSHRGDIARWQYVTDDGRSVDMIAHVAPVATAADYQTVKAVRYAAGVIDSQATTKRSSCEPRCLSASRQGRRLKVQGTWERSSVLTMHWNDEQRQRLHTIAADGTYAEIVATCWRLCRRERKRIKGVSRECWHGIADDAAQLATLYLARNDKRTMFACCRRAVAACWKRSAQFSKRVMQYDDTTLLAIADTSQSENAELCIVTTDPRQRQIVNMLADGHTQADIAEQLGVSNQRVSQIVKQIADQNQ